MSGSGHIIVDTRFRRSAAIALLMLTSSIAVAGQTGERWEYQNTMQMDKAQGFAMPTMTSQICQEPGWKTPPASTPTTGECKLLDHQRNGDKMSWHVQCPNGEGRGEMTLQGNDAFTGKMEFTSSQGNFRMQMQGRKLGSCDPAVDKPSFNGMTIPTAPKPPTGKQP